MTEQRGYALHCSPPPGTEDRPSSEDRRPSAILPLGSLAAPRVRKSRTPRDGLSLSTYPYCLGKAGVAATPVAEVVCMVAEPTFVGFMTGCQAERN